MDPENVRTLATSAATVTVGLVPALLLYLQNRASDERGARERREERESVAERASREQLEREAIQQAQELEADRQRYLRLLVILEKIATELLARSLTSIGAYRLTEDDRSELASAYSDVMLTDAAEARASATAARDELMNSVVALVEHGGALTTYQESAIRKAIDHYRDQARGAISARSGDRATPSEGGIVKAGQEPSTP